MAITAELHDGTRLEFPDGTDPAVIQRTVKNVLAQQATPQPTAVEAGQTLRGVPRQFGLTARYGLEGVAQTADIIAEPIRALVNLGARATGVPTANKSVRDMASGLADAIGLPSPQGANERVIGDASRFVASAGGLSGAANTGAKVTTGLARNVFEKLAAAPGKQAVSVATAGLSSGAVREAGGGPLEQFLASLGGGLTGGLAADYGQRGFNALRSLVTPQASQLQNADQQIRLVLERQGIDWSQVPERIRQSMRAEAARAMDGNGELNGDALRRLLVMQRAGVQPTVGQLTQDPGQITREMNLAKAGANSTDPSLQRLPALENQNTAVLLRRLDEAGAANAVSTQDAARSVIGSLNSQAGSAQREIAGLYAAARDSSGRSLPLEGGTFTTRASQLLDEAMVGGALPPGVQSTLNKIASGQMPLTVEIAEQLKTQMGKLQRAASDGQARMALGLVRRALDETPLMRGQNPGNLPTAAGNAGQDAINAFDLARSANRQWMAKVEGNPALKAALEGVEPDQFLSRYVLSKRASAGDVAALRQELLPDSIDVVRNSIVKHLRDAATGGTDDVVRFNNAAYRRALADLGDEKLAVFFQPEEVQLLKDVGNAAKYMQSQPAGSAVNNSNSGALLMGRAMDWLTTTVPHKLPLGLKDTISGAVQGYQQAQALSPANALARLAQQPQPVGNRLEQLLLLASPTAAQAGKDDQR